MVVEDTHCQPMGISHSDVHQVGILPSQGIYLRMCQIQKEVAVVAVCDT